MEMWRRGSKDHAQGPSLDNWVDSGTFFPCWKFRRRGMKTLAPTFSTVRPFILLENVKGNLTGWSKTPANCFLDLFDSSGFHLDSISAICPLDYACFLVFSRTSPHQKSHSGTAPFCLPPGSCQHSLCWLAPHVCFCLGKSSKPAACLYSLCVQAPSCVTAFPKQPEPTIMIPAYFCSLFSWLGLVSWLSCSKQNKRLDVSKIPPIEEAIMINNRFSEERKLC